MKPDVVARQYVFRVSLASVIRLSVCDWTSDSTEAIQGVVKVDVAQVMPVEWDTGATVWHKDWFVIRNAEGDAVRCRAAVEAVPANNFAARVLRFKVELSKDNEHITEKQYDEENADEAALEGSGPPSPPMNRYHCASRLLGT